MKKNNIHIGMLMIVILSFTSCKIDVISQVPEKQADVETTNHINQEKAKIIPYNYNYNEPYFNIGHTLDTDLVKVLQKNKDRSQSIPDNESEMELLSNLIDHKERTKSRAEIILPNRKEVDVVLFDRTMEMQIQ